MFMKKQNYIFHYLTILAIGLLYFVLIIWVLPQKSFFSPDNSIKFIQLKEMIKQETMNPAIEYPGAKIDQNLEYQPFGWIVKIEGDKIYSQYSPFYPWLSTFFYKWLGVAGLYIISALAGFFSLIVMYHLAQYYFNNGMSLISTLLLGLGTPIFLYSVVFWEHALAFFFSILILLMIIRLIEGKRKFLILLPPLIILGMWTRSESIVFILSLLLAGSVLFWKDIKKYRYIVLAACMVFLILIGVFVSFNLITSGTFFGIHISKHILNYDVISSNLIPNLKRAKIITTLLGRSGHPPSPLEIVTTTTAMTALLVSLSAIFLLRLGYVKPLYNKWLNLALYLSITAIIVITVVNLSKQHYLVGLIQVTPFVIFSLFSFLEKEENIYLRFVKLSAIIYFVLAFFMPAAGGMQWGPRYILYIYPLLIILCWNALPVIKKKFSKPGVAFLQGAFVLLFLCSFVLQSKGIMKLNSRKNAQLQVRDVVAAEPTGVIISGFENYLTDNSPDLYNKKMFFYADNNNVNDLIRKLYNYGITKFSVSSSVSMVTGLEIKTENLLSLRMPDSKRVYFVDERYRNQKDKKGLVLTMFEIR